MKSIDEKVIEAADNDKLFAELINENKGFIINCAFRATSKYISDSDDEWSIALIAFSNAVKTYERDKSNFLVYADMLIKRQLIDYYRSTNKYRLEFNVNPSIFEMKPNDNEIDNGINNEISKKLIKEDDNSIKYEIEALKEELKKYSISFSSLEKHSPKSVKTRESCKKAILFILDNEMIKTEVYVNKKLPIKIIQKNTDLPRKLIEHHRIYIIATIVILSGEYPKLAEYLEFIRKRGI